MNENDSIYIAYVKRAGAIELLGPIRETKEEIEQVVQQYKNNGWNNSSRKLETSWVEIGKAGPYIISPSEKKWWKI